MFPGKGARRADAGLKISMTPDSAQRIFWEPNGQKILCRSWCGEGSYGTKISMTPDSAQRIFWEPSGQKILCRSLVRGGVIRN